jgi:hypothetical protein
MAVAFFGAIVAYQLAPGGENADGARCRFVVEWPSVIPCSGNIARIQRNGALGEITRSRDTAWEEEK